MKLFSSLLIGMIKIYQWTLSPFIGQSCRFFPTCSQYAIEAMHKHGALRGAFYTIRRLSRCHPWHAGGHDPVP
ncbi:membrane protein insertion efficiency factor YidD [Methylobacillus gramineus]|uniref:membrane protein insertion efficiency factor YidD n=1 Tax=Methylobacillus gramineus TaxID=755169 RepID=UPI001CFFDE67|nr:membrane protein insertion efficiency factor YidD [Methylobacillus gramineus]MCB5185716.1 membrane protein insertion efficiency factor YidD [Methylobacillus gramineus]